MESAVNLREAADHWVALCRGDKVENHSHLDAVEERAVALLCAAPMSPFRLEATVMKEWGVDSLYRIARAAGNSLGTNGAVVYVPPLPPDWQERQVVDLIERQAHFLKVNRVDAVFLAGCEGYEIAAMKRLVEVVTKAGARSWVLVESQYVGLREIAIAIGYAIQKERANHARAALDFDPQLSRCAMLHAMDITRRGEMSHDGSDGSTPFSRAVQVRYACVSIGENLAIGTLDPTEIVERWMSSTNHRANVLGPFHRIGVAVAAARGTVPNSGVLNPSCVAMFASVL
jgi:hypothetical protein